MHQFAVRDRQHRITRVVTQPSKSGAGLSLRCFFDQEHSWFESNGRLLDQTEDSSNPLPDRLRSLALFSRKLDEFFSTRITAMHRVGARQAGAAETGSVRPGAYLERIHRRIEQLVARQYRCWNDALVPDLARAGVRIVDALHLTQSQAAAVDRFFCETAFAMLTPMAIDLSHPKPAFRDKSLYLGALLRRTGNWGPDPLFAIVPLPPPLPRLVPLAPWGGSALILLEEVIAAQFWRLFGGYQPVDWTLFRVTRDGEIHLPPGDVKETWRRVEQTVTARRRSAVVRLEVAHGVSVALLDRLSAAVSRVRAPSHGPIQYGDLHLAAAPIDLSFLLQLAQEVEQCDASASSLGTAVPPIVA